MLGKLGIVAGLILVWSCAYNVAQDEHTGDDGKQKGAKSITLDNGEGKARGIVTYPGGDRVDWKLVELPEKKRGTLDVRLTWDPPRPGLQLAFDVFDEWNALVVSSNRGTRKRSRGRSHESTIENAKGKYYIRVYAMARGDAGKYRLEVAFKEGLPPLGEIDLPGPPRLPAVPEPEKECDPSAIDPKNPACKDTCPKPPDVNNEACWPKMPCPNPPDRRVKACTPSKWPKCNFAQPDPGNPNCDTPDPVTGRVIHNEVQGNDVLITISLGSDQRITKSWKGHVLRGDTESYLESGEVALIRVGKRESVGRVHLTLDQLNQNHRVKLTPP
jgi:hypothetical protein